MEPLEQEDASGSAAGWFKTTHWSVVLDAGCGKGEEGATALSKLCQSYWHPIYTYLRRCGHNPDDAKDSTQSFFARLLEKGYLKKADREKGRFRSFLLIMLKRFMANENVRARRLKRGGEAEIVALDANEAETRYLTGLVDYWTPEKAFEQQWAMTLLERVMNRLAQEVASEGKAVLFTELRPFLTGEGDHPPYSELAAKLEMTEGNLRVQIHRIRHRYRQLLRLEIAETVDSPEAVDDEIRYLVSCFSTQRD